MAGRPNIAPWGPHADLRGWLRSLGITLGAAVFMAYIGAFGSARAPVLPRIGYWVLLMTLGWLWGTVVSRFCFRRQPTGAALWWRVVGASLVLAIPYSAVVALATHLMFNATFELADAPGLIISVTAVSFVMIAINVMADRSSGETAASAEPAKFLERLPIKLRGAEIWAVESEDHYLRLHTSKGQDLILLRLADAIRELEGIEGAQVHRSWWIARDAIADARRGDGRATLTLKDGAEVPVSRTYAGVLREKGWI